MAHWRTVLPADRIMDLDYEAMAANREEQTRRLIAFCGLQWDDACLVPERNQRPVHTASVWQARQPVYTTRLTAGAVTNHGLANLQPCRLDH